MRRLIATAVLAALAATACGGSATSTTDTTAELSPSVAAVPMPTVTTGEPTSSPTAASTPTATTDPPPTPPPTPARPDPPAATVVPSTPGTAATPRTGIAAASLPVGVDPVRIEIPAIGVDADIVDLDLAGPAPEVPADFAQAGWYVQTREPGEIGPAVIAGHVDSAAGPAVFFRLDELAEGDEIVITDPDGATRTFAVTGSDRYPKDALAPEVFGFGEPEPELRLITCGGTFDPTSGHYRDNVVVYARLIPR